MRANEALDAVTEHHLMHVRRFYSSAIVVKRDCGLWHELMGLFIHCVFVLSAFQFIKKKGALKPPPQK
jgi:hypothetical protein